MKYHAWNTSCLKVSINICFALFMENGVMCSVLCCSHCITSHHIRSLATSSMHSYSFILCTGDDELGYLHIIEESHVDMLKMYEEVRQIVQSNWYGPKIYLHPIYRYYFVLLARKMKLITEKIFTQRTIPDLPVSYFSIIKRFW